MIDSTNAGDAQPVASPVNLSHGKVGDIKLQDYY